MVPRIFFIVAILYFSTPISLNAQNSAQYFIKNFNRSDYKASISNFDIVQDNNGFIYIANFDGLLIYNGSDWSFTKIDGNSVVFSIATDNNNRIYIGSEEDFGYLKVGSDGKLAYSSLTNILPENTKFSPIRKILTNKDGTYFVSSQAIFILSDKKKIRILKPENRPFSYYLFNIKDSIYSYNLQNELVNIQNPKNKSIKTPSNISAVTFLASNEEGEVIGTYSNGLFQLSAQKIKKIDNQVSADLSFSKIITGNQVTFQDSVHYIFGTPGRGLYNVNSALNGAKVINRSSGLQSDIIRKIALDHQMGVWTAMQEGISHIELYSPWNFWNQNNGLEGTPWDIIKYNNNIFVGTTKGLFILEDGQFSKISGIASKVWSLTLIKKMHSNELVLLAGTEEGLFEISDYTAKQVSKFPEITKLYSPPNNPEKVYVGHRAGISALSIENNKYIKSPILNQKHNTTNSMLMDPAGRLWASSKFLGINLTSINKDSIFNKLLSEKSGLPDVNKVNIFLKDNKPLFSTDHGIYKANQVGDSVSFTYDTSLIKYPANIGVISKARNEDYYVSIIKEDRTEHIERLHKVDDDYIRDTTPFKRLPEMEILAIYPEDNGIVWIAGSEGLFRYDSKVKKDYTLPFNTVISKASVRDSIIFHGFYPVTVEGSDIPGIGIIQPEDMQPTLTYDDNSVTFEYAATSYEVPEKNQFSYYLENNDRGWSNWSTETKKEYNNLDPGEYTFFVKSKNIYGTEGRLATYKFKVLPPWYQTAWAYVIWSVLTGFVVWFITIAYSVRVRTQRKKLQLIVADRTYEVMTQKKEIEQQNHLLKAKNEEISFQKDDIQKKNSQLKESQEEILSMNQKLTELNMYLEKKVEKRTSKIKATLKQLQQINGELDTFVYRASHDLKGPISRINGITSLAKLESPDDINLKYFDMIEHTAKDMEVLLSKLAQVHEIINCKPRKEEIDIPSLLSEIRDMIKFLDKGLKTKYSFDLNQINITSDRYLLSIIIKNLIENALIFRKSASAESHHIHISTNTGEGLFEIKIKDNGIGIHTPHLNMIFQMFFRGSDKSKGSGLGLYLVKMCIDKLKASIEVESKENEFTEFTITIPL